MPEHTEADWVEVTQPTSRQPSPHRPGCAPNQFSLSRNTVPSRQQSRVASPWERTKRSSEKIAQRLSSRLAPRRTPQIITEDDQPRASSAAEQKQAVSGAAGGSRLPSRAAGRELRFVARHNLPRRFTAKNPFSTLANSPRMMQEQYPIRQPSFRADAQQYADPKSRGVPPQARLNTGAFPTRPRYDSGPLRVTAGGNKDQSTHIFVMKEPTRDMIAMPIQSGRSSGLRYHSGENTNLSRPSDRLVLRKSFSQVEPHVVLTSSPESWGGGKESPAAPLPTVSINFLN